MFKIILIFLTVIFYKILANKFKCSNLERIMQSNIIVQCKAKLVTVTYNIIYFYSVCQIKCNQLYNKVSHYLEMFKTENNLIDDINNDAIAQLGIDKSKHDAVQDYLESLYDLSDGISVIMAPGIEFQYTNIDQVQRFQY